MRFLELKKFATGTGICASLYRNNTPGAIDNDWSDPWPIVRYDGGNTDDERIISFGIADENDEISDLVLKSAGRYLVTSAILWNADDYQTVGMELRADGDVDFARFGDAREFGEDLAAAGGTALWQSIVGVVNVHESDLPANIRITAAHQLVSGPSNVWGGFHCMFLGRHRDLSYASSFAA